MLGFLNSSPPSEAAPPRNTEVPRGFEPVREPVPGEEWTLVEFAEGRERDSAGNQHIRARVVAAVLHPHAHPHTIVAASREVLRKSLENTLPTRWVSSGGEGVERQRTATALYVRNFLERPVWLVQHADVLARVAVGFRAWQDAYTREQAESLAAAFAQHLRQR